MVLTILKKDDEQRFITSLYLAKDPNKGIARAPKKNYASSLVALKALAIREEQLVDVLRQMLGERHFRVSGPGDSRNNLLPTDWQSASAL